MEKILRLFTESSLYDACLQMLGHLQVAVNEVTRETDTVCRLVPRYLFCNLAYGIAGSFEQGEGYLLYR